MGPPSPLLPAAGGIAKRPTDGESCIWQPSPRSVRFLLALETEDVVKHFIHAIFSGTEAFWELPC